MSKRHISLYAILGRLKERRASEPTPPVVKRMFLLSFMSEFIVIYPFYLIMFGERSDISPAGVGFLVAVWMIVAVLAEVPTGVIADKMSKKWSMIIGYVMQTVGFSLWLFFPNFVGYLLGFIIWGIGEAFISGAFQAYLYEALDDKKSFAKLYSRTNAFTMMAYMSGSFCAFLIGPQYVALLVFSVLVSVITVGIAVSLPKTHSNVEVDVEVKPKVLASALRSIRFNAVLQRIIVGAVLLQALVGMLAEYLPAYYYQVGIPLQWVPLVVSVGSAVAAGMYWWMHHAQKWIERFQPILLAGATALFVLSFFGGVFTAVLGFFLYTRVIRTIAVFNESQIQHHAKGESRATLGSIYSFVAKILSAGLMGITGVLAVGDKVVTPIRWVVVVMIVLILASGVYFWAAKKHFDN